MICVLRRTFESRHLECRTPHGLADSGVAASYDREGYPIFCLQETHSNGVESFVTEGVFSIFRVVQLENVIARESAF